jgi:hypothetical protein
VFDGVAVPVVTVHRTLRNPLSMVRISDSSIIEYGHRGSWSRYVFASWATLSVSNAPRLRSVSVEPSVPPTTARSPVSSSHSKREPSSHPREEFTVMIWSSGPRPERHQALLRVVLKEEPAAPD